jgi:cytochrome b6-f complex iron-sulfur subunit
MDQLNRREVLTIATAACLCGLADTSALLADDMPSTAPSSAATTLDVGLKSDYSTDGITDTWMPKPAAVAIVRNGGKLYATTTICTHRGCAVKKATAAADGTPAASPYLCPCHKATYDIDGKVTKGPAKVSLLRYAISVDSNSHVIVDKSTKFDDTQWDDPASFIKLDA